MTYPNKPAQTDYPISDLIKNRWSPRVFSGRPIEREKIMRLFEAARWAPSSFNEQPWRYVYAPRDDAGNFDKLASLLIKFNFEWAGKSALLIVSFAKKNFSYNSKPNYHYLHDTGAASCALVLEAVNQGLAAHQMDGFDKARAIDELGFNPYEFKAGSMIAVGYPADLSDLEKIDEESKKTELAERSRKKLSDIIFEGKFK